MCTHFFLRMSLAVLICVFFVLPNFAGRAHNGQFILLQSSSLDGSSYANLPQEASLYIFLTSIPQIYLIASATGIIGASSIFFKSPTNLLGIALIVILLLLTLSLYRRNLVKSTAHKLLKDENAQLQQDKESAEKEANGNAQCLSTICHEVRTPLSSSTGIVQLLLDSELNREQLEYLNALQFSSNYLISLADNVLMLNKLDVRKPEINNEPFGLKETFDHLIKLLQSSARDNNTRITLEYDPRIPKEINGDNTKISQILINLLSNAVNFTDNGKIWIRTLAKNITADTVEILVEIQDTGLGIPKEEHALIFESFSQGMLSKNKRKGGTGLGLAIVKVLLEILGSEIHLESELGKGSRFWFTLQCNYVPFTAIKVNYKVNETQAAILANKSVLLVEDDLISKMITKKILERER